MRGILVKQGERRNDVTVTSFFPFDAPLAEGIRYTASLLVSELQGRI